MTQDQALNILKTGANVFLTGEPGNGKTYATNQYVSWLRKHGISPAITASTGIAATHIGGTTIHSYSGIGVAESLSDWDIDRIASIEKIAKRILATSVLIIDEVSMLSANTLQMVEKVFRSVRRSDLPFGGVQVILVGDFFQLPPVGGMGKTTDYAFESEVWKFLNPAVCYLSEQHRQADRIFLEALFAIRHNSVEETHREAFLSRRIDLDEAPVNVPKLFAHNFDVDRINAEELARLPDKSVTFSMASKGSKNFVEQLKRGCLSPEKLELKIEAAVMFTKNSPQSRFVNGTLGVVMGFNKVTSWPIVKIKNGSSMEVPPMKWQIEEHGKVKGMVEQVPLRLAWAITIHKSQGITLDEAVVDLSRAFEYGQGYVALSRVRSLKGLHLLGLNEKALMVHPKILSQDEEFRRNSAGAESNLNSLLPELKQLQEQFVRACGGKIEEIEIIPAADIEASSRDKAKRWEYTLELVQGGKSLSEVAKLRGRTVGTIYTHLEELHKLGKIERSHLAHLIAGKESTIDEINLAQKALGADKLTPVFEHFKGRYSYNDIRLARLWL